MKFYIAADFNRKEEVRELYDTIRKRGHTVAFDWTVHKPITPFEENPETAR